MANSEILIVPGKDGWRPTRNYVRHLLDEMQIKGLRNDWKYCQVLQTRALMFSDDSDPVGHSDLIAYKGDFLTEREYLEGK